MSVFFSYRILRIMFYRTLHLFFFLEEPIYFFLQAPVSFDLKDPTSFFFSRTHVSLMFGTKRKDINENMK